MPTSYEGRLKLWRILCVAVFVPTFIALHWFAGFFVSTYGVVAGLALVAVLILTAFWIDGRDIRLSETRSPPRSDRQFSQDD